MGYSQQAEHFRTSWQVMQAAVRETAGCTNEKEPWYEIQQLLQLLFDAAHDTIHKMLVLEAMHDDEACLRPIRPTRDRE